jgi:hypothetical protein
MAVTIEEVTAEVEPPPPETRGRSEAAGEPRQAQPSDLRRQREHFERMQQRASRVCAD